MAEIVGEGKDNIRRYIRLNELVPSILDMVDEENCSASSG